MPGGTRYSQGNIIMSQVIYLPSVVVPNVNANSTVNQTVTVNGVVIGDFIDWNQLSSVSGLTVANIWVSAANTLTFTWANETVGNITNTANQPFQITITRPENVSFGLAALPNGIY